MGCSDPYCPSTILGVLSVLILISIAIRQYLIKMCTSKVRLDEKIAIVTGANTGIGLTTVIDLAKRGAIVIMACRNMEKGKKALQIVKEESGSNEIVLMKMDLASLKSIREFAKEFLSKYQKLDILINNAGIMMCPYQKTEDGFEMQIGTNHFGHFVLTNLLLKALEKAAPSRIINVTSGGHKLGKIDFNDINYEKRYYNNIFAYGQSKLANILFTKELHRKLSSHGITSYAVHPGMVDTELGRYSSLAIAIFHTVGRLYSKTPVQGAQTTIYCAVEEGLEEFSGGYFENCGLDTPSKDACNEGYAKKLWELSEQLTDTSFGL